MGQPLNRLTRDRIRAAIAIFAFVVGLFVILNFEGLLLAGAIILSEKRPALLRDAEWDDPASAVRFENRFYAGVAEEELLGWLRDNRFSVDQKSRVAERSVGGGVCNENARVDWSVDRRRRLVDASATVTEAGCL